MANSIQIALTKGNENEKYGKYISAVLLMLNTHATSGKVVFVVEGCSDKRLYGKMYDEDKIVIYPVNNCRHTVKVIKALNGKGYSNRLLGIKDADFDRVNNVVYSYENLFITDYHDAEILALENGVTINSVWRKYLGTNAPVNIKNDIYNDLLELSMLKWYNNSNHCNIVFNKIGAFTENGTFDSGAYVTNLFSVPENSSKQPLPKDYDLWKTGRIAGLDKRQITNGHDFVELLFHKVWRLKRGNMTIKDVARRIVDCYPLEIYRKTGLSLAIDGWARKNGVVLRNTDK